MEKTEILKLLCIQAEIFHIRGSMIDIVWYSRHLYPPREIGID